VETWRVLIRVTNRLPLTASVRILDKYTICDIQMSDSEFICLLKHLRIISLSNPMDYCPPLGRRQIRHMRRENRISGVILQPF
jgi:hypothetical protein